MTAALFTASSAFVIDPDGKLTVPSDVVRFALDEYLGASKKQKRKSPPNKGH